ISISLSRPFLLLCPAAALTPACAAFTSDDLPMPRAPQSNALLAGKPLGKRPVFLTRTSGTRSIPFRSDISTRFTWATGASRPSGCQINASAAARSARAVRCGARRSSATAIRSSVSGCPAGRVPPFGLGAERCEDLDFDLAIRVSVSRAALSGARFLPQASLRENGRKRGVLRVEAALQLGGRPL